MLGNLFMFDFSQNGGHGRMLHSEELDMKKLSDYAFEDKSCKLSNSLGTHVSPLRCFMMQPAWLLPRVLNRTTWRGRNSSVVVEMKSTMHVVDASQQQCKRCDLARLDELTKLTCRVSVHVPPRMAIVVLLR